MLNFFKEDNGRDFPYYNNNPHISKAAWLALLLCIPISYILYMLTAKHSEFIGSIVFCMVMLIPLLYYSNWDYNLIFHKLTKNEVILAVLLFIAYICYSVLITNVLEVTGIYVTTGTSDIIVNMESIVSLLFSMMAEELLKFIPLMFLLRVFYKFSNRRDVALVFASIIVLSGFGLLHYTDSILAVLLLQGLGSVFELYGYVKTKNLLVPYLSHLLTDAFIMTLLLLQI